MISQNRIVYIIDQFVKKWTITESDYKVLVYYMGWVLTNHRLKVSLDPSEVLDEMLYQIKMSSYSPSKSDWEKKNYINLQTLYATQKLSAVYNNIISIPPYALKEYIRYKTWAVDLSKKEVALIIWATEVLSLSEKTEHSIWTSLWREELEYKEKNWMLLWMMWNSLDPRERKIIDLFYRQWYSKKEIWEKLWVSWERIRQIINRALLKCKKAVGETSDYIE